MGCRYVYGLGDDKIKTKFFPLFAIALLFSSLFSNFCLSSVYALTASGSVTIAEGVRIKLNAYDLVFRVADDFSFNKFSINSTGFKFDFDSESFSLNASSLTVDSVSIDGLSSGDYVYAEEQYYEFIVTVSKANAISEIGLVTLSFSDGVHWINSTYDDIGGWMLRSGDSYAILQSGSVTALDVNSYEVTFNIFFKDKVLDCDNIDVYASAYEYSSEDMQSYIELYSYPSAALVETDLFGIFSFGLSSVYTFGGNAGHIEGGGVFELYAYKDSWALSNVTVKNLQNYHALFYVESADVDSFNSWENDVIPIEFGIDYLYNGSWLRGWSVKLELQSDSQCYASGLALFWGVNWYWRGAQVGSGVYVSSYPYYKDDASASKTSFTLDLWFDRLNSSSVIGGRIASEYYGMVDNSATWTRWLSSNWGAIFGNSTQSMFSHVLTDAYGETISIGELTLSRVWAKIGQADNANDVKWSLRDFDIQDFNYVKEGGKVEGINTPILIATKLISMPQTGFYSALASAILVGMEAIRSGISTAILYNLIIFFSAIDLIFALAGYPGLVFAIWDSLASLYVYFMIIEGYALQLIPAMMNFITVVMPSFLLLFVQFLSGWVTISQSFFWVLGYTAAGGKNIYETLTPFIPMLGVAYFLFLVTLWEKQGLSAMLDHVTMMIGLIGSFGGFLYSISEGFINLLFRIIEVTPVAE